jgi:hypothetical protein
MEHYFSVCASYQNEAPFLREWVEFHLLVGVEKFFLYDNASQDKEAHFEVLAPYVEDGSVEVRDWPQLPGQVQAFQHCLRDQRGKSRWLAFFDLDEFLFSPTGQPIPELLVDYERWPGLVVNRATFGTSGHRTRPPGLVIENYVRRSPEPASIKSIVYPQRTLRCLNPHGFAYSAGGMPVDEQERPVDGLLGESFTMSRVRINHYWTKSEEECARKFERMTVATPRSGPKPWPGKPTPEMLERCNSVEDRTIFMYLPALKEAVVRRDGVRRAG